VFLISDNGRKEGVAKYTSTERKGLLEIQIKPRGIGLPQRKPTFPVYSWPNKQKIYLSSFDSPHKVTLEFF
jgi:hypothetical protein